MTLTKDREKCGVPINKVGDKTSFIDPETKQEIEKTFKSERVIKDSEGNIIGVEKEWQ